MMRFLNTISSKLFFAVIFVFITNTSALANKTDSLIHAIRSGKEDSLKVKALYNLAYVLKSNNPDTAIDLSEQALQLAKKINWKKGIGTSLRSLGACNRLKGNFNVALEYYFLALETFNTINNKTEVAITLGNIGIVYKNQANYPKALEYEFKALHMAGELKDKPESARHNANIGLVFLNQGDSEKAIEYLSNALKLYRELNDKDGVANCLGSIGSIYGTEGSNAMEKGNSKAARDKYFPEALEYYEEALALVIEMGEKRDIALYYDNIAVVYKDQGAISTNENEKARLFGLSLDYHLKSLAMNESISNTPSIGENNSNIGALYKEMAETLSGGAKNKMLREAKKYLIKAENIYKDIGALNYLVTTEGLLSDTYSQLGEHQAAYDHYLEHVRLKDTLFNQETRKKTLRAEMNFEFEKKQALTKARAEKKEAVVRAAEERERQKNRTLLTAGLVGLLLMIVFSSFIFRAFRQKQKDNVIITRQKEIVERQKGLVEEKQKEVLDSIHYARRIQAALLASETYISRQLQKLRNT